MNLNLKFEYHERYSILGMTGSGKTVLGKHILKSLRNTLIYDIERMDYDKMGVIVHNLKDMWFQTKILNKHKIVYQPSLDSDLISEAEVLVKSVFGNQIMIGIDEAHLVYPKGMIRIPRYLHNLLSRGRKYKTGGVFMSQAYTELHNMVMKQSNYVFLLSGLNAAEADYLRKLKFIVPEDFINNINYRICDIKIGTVYNPVPHKRK